MISCSNGNSFVLGPSFVRLGGGYRVAEGSVQIMPCLGVFDTSPIRPGAAG